MDGGEVVILTHWWPFTPKKIPGTYFCWRLATVQLEGLSQLQNPVTSSGTEPTTFWLVVQCLNQLCWRNYFDIQLTVDYPCTDYLPLCTIYFCELPYFCIIRFGGYRQPFQ
jgi:hypothetical protein